MLSVHGIVHFLSCLFFLLLFPGFYIYHQSVASGLVPAFLGGWFSPVCIAAILFLIPFWKYWFFIIKKSPFYSFLILLFFFWSGFVALISYALDSSLSMQLALNQYMVTLLQLVALTLIGAGLSLEIKWFRCSLWVFGFFIFSTLLYHVFITGSFRYYAAILYDVDGVASYQGFARSAFLIALILLSISRSFKTQALVAILAAFVLFVLSARSEFVALLASIGVYYLLTSGRYRGNALSLVLVVASLVLVVIRFGDMLLDSRHVNLLNLDSDSSWQVRGRLGAESLGRISESPFFGGFGGHFESGGAGSYAHSVLSVWDSFGLLGFLTFAALILVPFLKSWFFLVMKSKRCDALIMLALLSFSVLLLTLFAKSVFWPIPALLWGVYLNSRAFNNDKNL